MLLGLGYFPNKQGWGVELHNKNVFFYENISLLQEMLEKKSKILPKSQPFLPVVIVSLATLHRGTTLTSNQQAMQW